MISITEVLTPRSGWIGFHDKRSLQALWLGHLALFCIDRSQLRRRWECRAKNVSASMDL
jgi:hypothetical protein